MGMKGMLALGAVGIVAVIGYQVVVVPFTASKEVGEKSRMVQSTHASIMNSFADSCKQSVGREGPPFYVGTSFQSLADTTQQQLKQNFQTLPPLAAVPSAYREMEIEMRQVMEQTINDVDAMKNASKVGNTQAIAAAFQASGERNGVYQAHVKENLNKKPGWGK